MQTRHGAWERLSAVIEECGEVRLAYLFGSRARGTSKKDSDFDIAVLLDEASAQADRSGVLRRLAGRLGRVVASQLLDLVVLNDAPSLLRHRILRDGILLYQRSSEEHIRFAIRTIREYQDGGVRRREFTEQRIRRLKAGEHHGGSRDILEKARSVGQLFAKAQGLPRSE